MRPLTEKEAKAVFEKLFKFVGKDVEAFLRKKEKESYCFRLGFPSNYMRLWTISIYGKTSFRRLKNAIKLKIS